MPDRIVMYTQIPRKKIKYILQLRFLLIDRSQNIQCYLCIRAIGLIFKISTAFVHSITIYTFVYIDFLDIGKVE